MVNQDIPKPNFIIIGSAKCGTTTLADVLASHPDCCFSRPKEVAFFSHDENYSKGWEWYQQAFSHYQGEKVIGEATPNYTHMPSHPNCAERIKQLNPDTKIIYITRHPYQKLVSEWKMDHHNSMLPELKPIARKGFEYYVRYRQNKHSVLDNCLFDYQLKPYCELFPKEQIKVIFLEDWIKNFENEVSKLLDFLDLSYTANNFITSLNRRGKNRAEERREETKHFKYFRRIFYSIFWQETLNLKKATNLISPIHRKNLIKILGTKLVIPPTPDISTDYKQEIVNYLRNDAIQFLKKYNKPESFWDFDNI